MKSPSRPRQEWLERGERGMTVTIRLMVWIALTCGRSFARLLLHPICVYFLVFSIDARRASHAYLTRVLGRPASLADVYRHYHEFACCVLDRVYFLNDDIDQFDLVVTGEEVVMDLVSAKEGCLLFGAHIGSFEALRAAGRRRRNLNVSVLMYEDRKINAVLNAINPDLAMDIIALGKPGSMMEIRDRLDLGGVVGVLADRSVSNDDLVLVPFLGAPARFPLGPFRMAALLKRPVVLMVGLYRGGHRYEVSFELLFDPREGAGGGSAHEAVTRYAARLEHYCRSAPYNWFNFYDFWT